jgi:DNA-binding transcriptional MerR regulator
MLKVGDFSALSQVSIKTLRYCDQTPAHIDSATGYRCYSAQQIRGMLWLRQASSKNE